MASFVVYDLAFLVLFTLVVGLFLYRNKHKLKRQGILYLYHTKVGIKVMDWFAKKFHPIMRPLEYVVVASGYILMVVMIWMLARFTYIYTVFDVAKQIKIPPVLPLFPYATDLFKVDFLPPFYFTYWIVIIAVIAVSHEFAHGIFARLNKIKVHSTGFGFMGPFLAAFVEPDEKQMQKAPKFAQLSVLAAGTFANVLMTLLFGIILWIFFVASFTPAGVNFNAFPTAEVEIDSITSINGVPVTTEGILAALDGTDELVEITSGGEEYLVPEENIRTAVSNDIEGIRVFEDAPAIRADLSSPIVAIDDQKITDFDVLRSTITSYAPGDEVTITTLVDGEPIYHIVTLGDRDGEAYLGIGANVPARGGFTGWIYNQIAKVKDPFIHYEAHYGNDLAWFIYNMLWWLVLINISVALVNMLPVGIFDGGRFFYLTVWGLTGKEKWGRKAFAWATYLILAVLVWLMVVWAFAVF